jgi:hypothetical protein
VTSTNFHDPADETRVLKEITKWKFSKDARRINNIGRLIVNAMTNRKDSTRTGQEYIHVSLAFYWLRSTNIEQDLIFDFLMKLHRALELDVKENKKTS